MTPGRPAGRRRARVPGLTGAILVLLMVGGAALALAQHVGGRPSGPGGVPAPGPGGAGRDGPVAAGAVRMAAEWISQQLSRSVVVACDPVMCSALEARGEPAPNLLVMGASAANPLGAEVVVATPAIRSQFGGNLDSVYAPSVIAGFGSGASRVNVQVVAPHGAAAYRAALRQDVAARQAVGTQLLANTRIQVTARARIWLAAGEVDSRLLIMLPVLAAAHPVRVVAFGDPGPGASPGIPLCSVDLSGSGPAAMTDASYLRWLVSFVRAQLPPFAGSAVILRPGGQPIVRVEFPRPSPLGLLTNG